MKKRSVVLYSSILLMAIIMAACKSQALEGNKPTTCEGGTPLVGASYQVSGRRTVTVTFTQKEWEYPFIGTDPNGNPITTSKEVTYQAHREYFASDGQFNQGKWETLEAQGEPQVDVGLSAYLAALIEANTLEICGNEEGTVYLRDGK